MSYVVRPRVNMPKAPAWTVSRPAQLVSQPRTLDIVTRRYEISWLEADGEIGQKTAVAPAMPVFEQAFSALAQGALVQTDRGPVAVEDLLPGDMIATADAGLQKLTWTGAMVVFPNQAELGLPDCRLYRVTDGSYGHDRQSPDLILGSGARILPGYLATDSTSPLLAPADLVDGHSVIALNPVSSVRVFHLALARHSLIRANGVLIESYHPGIRPAMQLDDELLRHFTALFPQMRGLDGFGPVHHKRQG